MEKHQEHTGNWGIMEDESSNIKQFNEVQV